jgi:hypothetical protein
MCRVILPWLRLRVVCDEVGELDWKGLGAR